VAQAWPSTLPQFFSEDNFQEVLDGAVLFSDMDVGPKKARRRFTKGIDEQSVSIQLNKAQYSIFVTFFKTTIAGGSIPVSFFHPITEAPLEFRIKSNPRVSSIGGGNTIVSFEIEIMP
jgi:hypothetical protein